MLYNTLVLPRKGLFKDMQYLRQLLKDVPSTSVTLKSTFVMVLLADIVKKNFEETVR